MKPRIGIIYLCYGSAHYLHDVVESFARLTYDKELITLYFVPNGSNDNVVELIQSDVLPRSKKDLPEVVLLNDGVNRGFAGGNNQAIQDAMARGLDYVLLNNGDLRLGEESISEMVQVMENDARIASAQPLVRYWKEEEKINVAGGIFHIAGYGYAKDNLSLMSETLYEEVVDVAYASGSSAMYRLEALKEVGDLEEGFFMYHEDLELGLRLRIHGWRNVLVSTAFAFHDYGFSRNPKKFAWTELYRYVVVLAYYRLPTLVLLAPILFAVEVATWIFAIYGGWVKSKVWALLEWYKPRTWKLIFGMRRRVKRLRKITDRELLRFVSGKIEAQEQHNVIVEKLANPILSSVTAIMKKIVIW